MIYRKINLTVKQQLTILVLFAIGLNANTLFNEYAVDDFVVLTENKLVEKGINGIPEILNHDFFYGVEGTDENGLSGGRYRPFALVIFALEHQFFGENPFVSHLINVLLFALLIVLLFKLLQTYIFREQHKYLAFVTCLIFVVHPIHTEVIANVKSRDELIAFILLVITSVMLIKHTEKRSVVLLLSGLFFFFIAMLTRESAVVFIVVLPLFLYFFLDQSIKRSIFISLPLVAIFIGYMIIRYSVVGFKTYSVMNVLDAPFLYATTTQAFATKVFILVKYIGLLIFPHPLSCDYSYNQIPYIEVYAAQFIISLLVLLGLTIYALYFLKNKSLFSFCILYFFLTISLFANFVVDIGAPLAERLLFQPSLAFCIVVAAFYFKIEKKYSMLSNVTLAIILLLFSVKTIMRNAEWKNDMTLYTADVISAPNSARTNMYLAGGYIAKAKAESNMEVKNEYLRKAVFYGERAIKIYPDYQIAYLDLGIAYFGLLDYFKTADLWLRAYKINPANTEVRESLVMLSDIFLNEGNKFHRQGNIRNAITCYLKSVELNNSNVEAWYNLGGNYFLIDDTKNAINAWQNVMRLAPNHQLNKDAFY